MKNPYRSLLEKPLRLVILTTLILLFFVKLYPGYVAMFDRTVPLGDSGPLAVLSFGLALSCVLDLGSAYLLTMGWNDLVGRPWIVFLTPAMNVGAAVTSWVMYGWDRLVSDAVHREWWMVLGPAAVLVTVLLVQVVASVRLYFRVRV